MSSIVRPSVSARGRQPGGLPHLAAAWLTVVAAAAIAAGASLGGAFSGETDRVALVLLLVAGSVAQARATHIPGNQVFHTGLVFTVAAALLLPPAAVLLVCLGQHVPEWIRQRYPWYVQAFNLSNTMLSALVGWAVYHGSVFGEPGPGAPVRVVAAVAAASSLVLVNHGLLAIMLRLARGHSLKSSGLFGGESLLTDLVLAALGIVVALLAGVDPWAAPVAVVPLFLIHRALVVPTLREQARRDPKTDLLNMRGLEEAAGRELARAARFDRPLSVLVVDIDDLRGINNRHGHLVGDAALKTVAAVLREGEREYDVCARFGGDEFVVVLPETGADQVASIRDRLIEEITKHAVVVHDGEEIPVAASIGAATRNPRDASVHDIIRRADREMYAAKPDRVRLLASP